MKSKIAEESAESIEDDVASVRKKRSTLTLRSSSSNAVPSMFSENLRHKMGKLPSD
jgi:hypothetical protein